MAEQVGPIYGLAAGAFTPRRLELDGPSVRGRIAIQARLGPIPSDVGQETREYNETARHGRAVSMSLSSSLR